MPLLGYGFIVDSGYIYRGLTIPRIPLLGYRLSWIEDTRDPVARIPLDLGFRIPGIPLLGYRLILVSGYVNRGLRIPRIPLLREFMLHKGQ